MPKWYYRFFCKRLWCQRRYLHESDEGVGAKCIDCGAISGWVPSAEVLRLFEERFGPRLPEATVCNVISFRLAKLAIEERGPWAEYGWLHGPHNRTNWRL